MDYGCIDLFYRKVRKSNLVGRLDRKIDGQLEMLKIANMLQVKFKLLYLITIIFKDKIPWDLKLK